MAVENPGAHKLTFGGDCGVGLLGIGIHDLELLSVVRLLVGGGRSWGYLEVSRDVWKCFVACSSGTI